jgi:NADH-quinone oxidoreductase subunit G/NADP-reducing hydrogenase subunit HndD
VAVIYLTKNAAPVIEEVLRGSKAYDYIEVMACPGGCVGGGGQPKPTNMQIISERKKALYQIDDKTKIRKSHQNPVVKKFFEDYLAKLSKDEAASIINTNFRQRKKFE